MSIEFIKLFIRKPRFNHLNGLIACLVISGFTLSSFTTSAEQLAFTKTEAGNSYQFSYQWRDSNEQVQSLTFALAKTSLFKPFRQFRTYKPSFAQRYVNRHVHKFLRKNPIKGVHISSSARNNHIELKSQSAEQLTQAQRQINELNQKYFDEYLGKHFYHQFIDHHRQTAIKPDHVIIAEHSVDILKPTKELILTKVSVKNIRQVTDFVLGFVQTIPYSELESRITSSGAGFNVPTKVLWENQGDCDSKMTLTAALLRALMPRVGIQMIYLDNHAVIAIDTMAEAGDVTVNVNGKTYVVADPTGPRLMPLGEVSFDTKQAINAKHFVSEPMK